ncbi:hypothetical protein [Lysinibacillus fusiformis]|uniref:hypothetical protein n=1 Tax=Lysinibacillus fusiformis TaxID=28031 RepID=UPI003CFFDB73
MQLPPVVYDLVKEVVGANHKYDVVDWDLDRVYLENNEIEMIIRTWNITETYVDWTLFEIVNGCGKEISEGTYFYISEEHA